jgi:CheY-like chemotaxis protein
MMLRRILQNLLANALRYTRTGGVVMGCRRKGDRVRIQVSDTGPGISRAQQEAIFVEFQRGETSVGDRAGFGLGLSIVRRFASVLGHEVQLSSRLGHGSTFCLELDRADPALVREERRELECIDLEYGGLEGACILLIENDQSSAHAMATLFEKWGCQVIPAISAVDALQGLVAVGGVPDAIVADLHLEDQESGLTAVQEVRRQTKVDVPAVIVTADYSEAAAKEASLCGLEVLRKPVKPAEMRALLSFLLA